MTMISAIAAKAKSGSSLMAILSFPIIIPMLMFLLDVSIKGILGSSISETSQDLLVMSGLNLLIFSAGYLLFPYLWRD
jgi:heme exporter protein B